MDIRIVLYICLLGYDFQLWLEQVLNIKHSPNPDRVKSTIFEGILVSKAHDEEKEDHRLAHEAQLIVFAGQGPCHRALQVLNQSPSPLLGAR